jgi:hypothetical protein
MGRLLVSTLKSSNRNTKMTVAELIAILQTMLQDLPVSINDEENGNFYEDVKDAFQYDGDVEFGDRACVCLNVNSEE